MESPAEYLSRTESATRTLLDGIEAYIAPLKHAPLSVFGGSFSDEKIARVAFDHWSAEKDEQIQLSLKSQREFLAESFALATLCGCLLQIAAKGIEWFSNNTDIPFDFGSVIKPSSPAVPFCIGRCVRGVPVGLVIYAGRNQFAHFNERELREPNVTIFERLAVNHGETMEGDFKDPAFDLQNGQLVNFAGNITRLLGWRNHDAYATDMRQVLGVKSDK